MKGFDSMRRDFLRTGSLGVAAAAIPAVSLAASGQDSAPAGEPARNLFDVRTGTYDGALGPVREPIGDFYEYPLPGRTFLVSARFLRSSEDR